MIHNQFCLLQNLRESKVTQRHCRFNNITSIMLASPSIFYDVGHDVYNRMIKNIHTKEIQLETYYVSLAEKHYMTMIGYWRTLQPKSVNDNFHEIPRKSMTFFALCSCTDG